MRLNTAGHATHWHISTVSLPVLLAGVLALSGCGGSKSTTTASPATPATTAQSTSTSSSAPAGLSLAANPEGQLSYDKKSLTAKAGTVTVDFTNMAQLGHNMTVESSSGAVVGATPTFSGESKKLTLKLTPGTYKFYCSVPGHRQAGMEGTLTVN